MPFTQIGHLAWKGCWRTALEFGKVLLSLNVDDDPLCALLMIGRRSSRGRRAESARETDAKPACSADYFALRANEHEWLVRLYDEWNADRNLQLLPNFALSVALARRRQELESARLARAARGSSLDGAT